MENLREVPGTDGKYLIDISTKEGRCISLYNKYGLREKPRYLNTKPDKKGYIYWRMKINGVQVVHQAARWIAITYPELVENEYFEGAEIDHKDTDRLNNHPSNLRWVTRSGQMNNPLTRIHNSQARKGKHPSKETRSKMSAAQSGKTITAETRYKISEKHKGMKLSQKTKQKISAALKGRKGHKGSEKQRLAVLCLNASKKKAIQMLDKDGKVLAEYDSLKQAAVLNGLNKANISKAASTSKKCGGYMWKYKEKEVF